MLEFLNHSQTLRDRFKELEINESNWQEWEREEEFMDGEIVLVSFRHPEVETLSLGYLPKDSLKQFFDDRNELFRTYGLPGGES